MRLNIGNLRLSFRSCGWCGLALLFLPGLSVLQAQQIKCAVTLHLERLSLEEQSYLNGVDTELEQLFNNYQDLNGVYKYDLPLSIDLFPDKFQRAANYHHYTSGVMVASRSGIQLRDTRWDFKISRDQKLHLGQPYDTFTGLLEFYTWICLGFDLDLIEPMGGQTKYERAKAIAEAARFEGQYVLGWDYRRDLVRDLLQDTLYTNMRTAAYHVKAGLFYVERDEAEPARSHLVRAVELMLSSSPDLLELRRDDNIIRFVDIEKMAVALEELGEQNLLNQLSQWDHKHPDLYH